MRDAVVRIDECQRRYAIWGLIAIVSLAAYFVVPIGRQVVRQWQARKAIELRGGIARYGFEFDADGRFVQTRIRWLPVWMRTGFVADCWANIVDIEINTATVDDEMLLLMGQLPHLQFVIAGPRVTDIGLRALAGCRDLEHLYAEDSEVTDAGLAELAHLPNLRDLGLSDTRVTGVGLAAFARTDSSLEELDLSRSALSDEGCAMIGNIPSLQGLRIAGTGVTDLGMQALSALTRLELLDINRTKVTSDGVQEFQRSVPNCEVYQ
ncbi:MAG: hypothetical protein EXS05_07075 [Planctomycetaceae bacterium]|nr:hypothetical protein [Planctomycetaceae bacterium]